MQELVNLLLQKKLTIASVESLTAGLFTAMVAEVSGASQVLKGGLVTYQTACKEEVLHLDKAQIDNYGVISKEIADAMAQKGLKLFETDLCVSFTGNAGPDVMDDKPVGLVHMAIVYQNETYSFEKIFAGTRNTIRKQAVLYMKDELIHLIKD